MPDFRFVWVVDGPNTAAALVPGGLLFRTWNMTFRCESLVFTSCLYDDAELFLKTNKEG